MGIALAIAFWFFIVLASYGYMHQHHNGRRFWMSKYVRDGEKESTVTVSQVVTSAVFTPMFVIVALYALAALTEEIIR